MNAVSIKNLIAGYGDQKILNDLTLDVPVGELTALLGPNGAGKSTLFKVLTGLMSPFAGHISLFDSPLRGLSSRQRAKLVGVVPQDFKSPMPYTVEDIVVMGRTAVLGPWSGLSRADRFVVDKAMAYTDVMDLKNRPLDDLSGGEKQRVVIAMVLAQEPRLILMDEPTSHLDVHHRLEIMQIVERLNTQSGVTILMASHDLNLTSEFCRRLIILDHGEIAADGTPSETLREDVLKQVYHCDMRVRQDTETGTALVMPLRKFSGTHSGRGVRVHLVCGGGSGDDIIRGLSLAGFRLSCGVLNELDTDTQVAAAFGAEAALEKPFSPVGAEALQRAVLMSEQADVVVVAEVPFGEGNLANIEIAENALNKGKRVVIMSGLPDNRDYTAGRQACERIERLVKRGAEIKTSFPDLVASF